MLQHNIRLHTINLFSNQIGDAGAVALANALEHRNVTLDTLCLEENHIGDIGFAAMAKALHVNTTLDFLWISRNRPSVKGEAAFADSIANMRRLRTLKFGPIQKTTTLTRVAAAVQVNTRIRDIRCINDRDMAIAATRLHWQQRQGDVRVITQNTLTSEQAESQAERVRNLTTYVPMISFWCYFNSNAIHCYFAESERYPLWMWPYIIRRFQKAKIDGSGKDRY